MPRRHPKDDPSLSIEQALNILRYELEVDRLRYDQAKTRAESSFFARNFSAMLAGAIALAATLVSAANIFIGYVTNKSSADIATKKDLREFVAVHRSQLFGTDRVAAEQLRRTLEVTFPPKLVSEALEKIAPQAPPETRDIFNTLPKTGPTIQGRIGIWGGPDDTTVTPDEGLSLITPNNIGQYQEYFLPTQPPNTTGLARRLNPKAFYVSARWDFSRFPASYLRTHKVTVTNPRTGKSEQAQPVDWGPAAFTGRVADISPGLATALGLNIGEEAIIKIPEP